MSEDFSKVCHENDLSQGDIRTFNIEGNPILLIKHGDKIYALDNTCTHDGAELSDGDLVDGQIQCARHGGRFNLETGEATQMPAVVGIESYRVEIRDGEIYVSLKK